MANTVINTPELLNLDSTTGATILAKGTVNERPPTPTFSIDYLVVAGGGGGGGGVSSESPGAGGAGAVIYQAAGLNVIPSSEYTLYIADGGAGGGNNSQGTNGQDSYISFGGSNIVLAKGGGGGGSYSGPGLDGGSGGGGTRDGDTNSSQAGGSAVTTNIAPAGASIYGNNGASGTGTGGCSGGGGGAGEAGNTDGEGTGGDGVQINIDGNNYYWGGGGGACGSVGTGGQGGGGGGPRGGQGGTGGINPGVSTGSSADGGGNGGANTGGGGGGGTNPTSYPGGTGGSGIIILRYPNTQTITIGNGLTGTTSTVGSDKVTTFTAGTGTISFSGTVVGGDNDATDGALRFNTDTNKTEYFDGTGWYEIVDEYASGFIGPATNYFDTKLYTGNGATQGIGGYINGSGSFNGSSSKVVLPVGLGDNGDRTRSMWIKVGELPSSGSDFFFYIGNQGANDDYETLRVNSSGNIQLQERNDAGGSGDLTLTSSITLNVGQWYHIAYVFSGTSRKLYINNSTTDGATGTKSGGTVDNSSFASNLGQFRTLTPSYDGSIDQVRIYGTALSSSDVTALYSETAATATTAAFPSGQTAIATYTMDTSANGLLNTQDLSTVNYPAGAGCIALYEMNGNSNDTSETYNGTPTNITYEGGAFDKAAVFGSSSNILLPSNLISGTTDSDYSVSLWVKFDTLPGANFVPLIGQLSNTSAFRLLLYHNSGSTYNVGLLRTFGGTYYYNSPNTAIQGTFNVGQYYNVIVTYQSSNKLVNGYLNGNSIGSYTLNTTGSGAAGAIALGTYNGTTSYSFDGSLDQVRIFNTVLTQSHVTTLARGIATSYSGAATNVNFNGHLDFAPDFTWIKAREAAHDHVLVNSINGAGSNQGLSSNATYYNGQYTATYGYISSLNSNGFTVSAGSSYANYTNVNNQDYVSWNWKGGGAAVTNNDGTIASQVSANKDSGFSIVKYTGNSTAGATIGHGLSSTPEFIITKGLSGTDPITNWKVYNSTIGNTKYLHLNSTIAAASASVWNNTSPTSSVFSLGNSADNNGNGTIFIAYCWHSVAGYSKIGSYTGTNAINTITTGFEPTFLMVKLTSAINGQWVMYDNARSPTNPRTKKLAANSSVVENDGSLLGGDSVNQVNFTSTGFELLETSGAVNTNKLNETYIYLAIK